MGGGIAWPRTAGAGTLLLFLAFAGPAAALDKPSDAPVLISADELTYDENLAVVTASGNVEVSQSDRVLLADTVSYNQRTNVVTASGNVSLLEPSGEIVFADFVELTDDMREGFIRDVRMLLTDRSRLAAASGLRSGGRRTVLRKGVFSPCELCREDPTRAPLWQIKAVEIEHDQEDKVIRYRDAWMEMFGVPIAYVPYFEHPDPTVERKSGFLAPTFGSSEVLGTLYQQPYYWTIASNQDVTVAPIVTSKQGVNLTGEYRHLFPTGLLNLRASATIADREAANGSIEADKFRGHIDGRARFDLDPNWRGGLDVQRASDDTYMRLYNFSSERVLTSRAFVEGFNGRNYAAANGYLFQGLRADDIQTETPLILPMLDYNFVSEPWIADSRYSLDANLLVLNRDEGRDSRRLSSAVAWDLPFVGPLGDLYALTARVQADGYWVSDVDPASDEVNPSGATVSDVTGRVFPQLALNWRYPWARSDGGFHQVIQPMAQAVLAPNGSNPGKIPNEDSLDFEFDDTNLFSLNRFPGIDRVDPGSRLDYGLKWIGTDADGRYASAFLGQSYRFVDTSVFPAGAGVGKGLSDVVGRVQIGLAPDLDLTYRTRLDKDDLSPQRSEVDVRVGPPALNLTAGYVFIDSRVGQDEFGDREEITWSLASKLSRYWSVYGGQRVDLEAGEARRAVVGATYQDECFLINVVGERTFFSDREIEPEDAFFVNFVFKHLGGLSSAEATQTVGLAGLN